MSAEFPDCFGSYEQYAAWRAEAVKERDAAWEAHCRLEEMDPDSIRIAARRVYPPEFKLASICEDCTKEYQSKMRAAGRCSNPFEALARPTEFTGVMPWEEQ